MIEFGNGDQLSLQLQHPASRMYSFLCLIVLRAGIHWQTWSCQQVCSVVLTSDILRKVNIYLI